MGEEWLSMKERLMRLNVSTGIQSPELQKMAEAIELLQKVLGPMPDAVLTALIREKVESELASQEVARRQPSLN